VASGRFRLYCKPSESSPWGLLESFEYDDASRKKRNWRIRVLSAVRMIQMRWYYNYTQWRDAAFCCEEQEQYGAPVHIFGTKRNRPRSEYGSVQRRPFSFKRKRKAKVKPKAKARKAKPKKKGKKS
jgi:hypothetical protein